MAALPSLAARQRIWKHSLAVLRARFEERRAAFRALEEMPPRTASDDGSTFSERHSRWAHRYAMLEAELKEREAELRNLSAHEPKEDDGELIVAADLCELSGFPLAAERLREAQGRPSHWISNEIELPIGMPAGDVIQSDAYSVLPLRPRHLSVTLRHTRTRNLDPGIERVPRTPLPLPAQFSLRIEIGVNPQGQGFTPASSASGYHEFDVLHPGIRWSVLARWEGPGRLVDGVTLACRLSGDRLACEGDLTRIDMQRGD